MSTGDLAFYEGESQADRVESADAADLIQIAERILAGLRSLTCQADIARKVYAVSEWECDEPKAGVDLASAERWCQQIMVRGWALDRPVSVSDLQRLAELGEGFVTPISKDLLLEAIHAHIGGDYRRALLFAAIAVESVAATTLTAAYDETLACRAREPTLPVITLASGAGAVAKDPIFDVLIGGKPEFRRLLHETPLYLLRRSLLCDDEALFANAQRLYRTRNAIAHGRSVTPADTVYSLDIEGSAKGVDTAIQVFGWFGDVSPYTLGTHFEVPDPPELYLAGVQSFEEL